jgi:DNA-binding transcriptional LysR family regulator
MAAALPIAASTRLPPLDSGRLQTFLAVARERGFSRAARALQKTQSSVSQAVAQLELELGERLFDRVGRGALLTEAGRLLVPHAEAIFEQMQRARAHLEAARALETGELVIGTSDTLACYLLPPVLAAFRARFPRVDLRLDNRPSPATSAAVAERRVHLGVVSLPLPAPDDPTRVRTEPLLAQADRVILPPGHALAHKRRITLGDLARHPLLLLDRTTSGRAFLEAAFARLGLVPSVTMEMSSVEVLKRLVELGFGLSVVPAWAAAREMAAGSLVGRPIADLPGGRSVALVTPASTPLPRATAAFIEMARATLVPKAGPSARRKP